MEHIEYTIGYIHNISYVLTKVDPVVYSEGNPPNEILNWNLFWTIIFEGNTLISLVLKDYKDKVAPIFKTNL